MDSGVDMGGFSSLLEDIPPSPKYCKYDPIMGIQGRTSPSDFIRYDQDNLAGIDFTSPAKMYTEDCNLTPFMEAVPESQVLTLDTSVVFSPSSLAGDGEDNPLEHFQDLRHTSTPKQGVRPGEFPLVSGDRPRLPTGVKKSIEFPETGARSVSWHVLHDITSSNVLPQATDSFVKLSDSIDRNKKNLTSTDTPLIRKVPILRGNSRKRCDIVNATCVESVRQSALKEFLFPDRNPSVRERDKWLYYTGFTNYELMLKLLSHVSVPSDHGLTPSQILIMTLMRLRCDFDLKELSHRFNLFEPVVYSLYHSTLSLLSYALDVMIPWNSVPLPRSNITVMISPLTYRSGDSLKNIFVFLTDSRCPVLYVSDPLPSADKPLTLLSQLSEYFVTDDEICIKGMSRSNHPTFLKITKTDGNRLSYSFVEHKNSVCRTKFLNTCNDTVRGMRQYKLLLSKVPWSDTIMKQSVTVVSSLVNIKTSDYVSDFTLRNIYKRSYKAPHPSL